MIRFPIFRGRPARAFLAGCRPRRTVLTTASLGAGLFALAPSCVLVILSVVGEVAPGNPYPRLQLFTFLVGLSFVVGSLTATWTISVLRPLLTGDVERTVLDRAIDEWSRAGLAALVYCLGGLLFVSRALRDSASSGLSAKGLRTVDIVCAVVVAALMVFNLTGLHAAARAYALRQPDASRRSRTTQVVLDIGSFVRRVRRELVPRRADEVPADVWTVSPELWSATKRLRWLRLVSALFFVLYVPPVYSRSSDQFRVGLVFFCLYVVALTTIALRMTTGAVESAPRTPAGRAPWLNCRERMLYLAKMSAILLILSRVYFTVYGIAIVSATVGIVLARGGNDDHGYSQTVAYGLQPFLAISLSLLTLGSLALVNDLYKEAMQLRADVRYRDARGG